MDSREAILRALSSSDRAPMESVEMELDFETLRFGENRVAVFRQNLESAGGEVIETDDVTIEEISSRFDGVGIVVDTREETPDIPEDISGVSLAIFSSPLAVAENGAVWIEPCGRYPDSLLTLPIALAVVVSRKDIVDNMHEAYERVEIGKCGWGLFLSGPSKTADIEQSLVIGAHGAVEMKLFLTE